MVSLKFSRGAVYMFVSMIAISCMHLTVKFLTHLPVAEIILARSVFSIVVCLFTLRKMEIFIWGNDRPGLILRGIAGMLGLAFFFYSIQNLPLATAITIGNLMPFFTFFLAAFVLKEKFKPIQIIFFLIAFSGVFLIKGFDPDVSIINLLIAVAGAFFAGLAHFMVRKLKETEQTLVIVFYLPLVTIPFALPLALYQWQLPDLKDAVLLLLNGLFTHIGQIYLTKAYQLEEVNSVSGIYFTGIIFALIAGYLFFGEEISLLSLSGIFLIVIGVGLNLLYKK